MTAKISSDERDLIASASVFSFRGKPIEIEIGTQEILKFIIEFEDQSEKNETSIHVVQPDPYSLKLTLKNFKSSLGTGSTHPVSVGTLDDHEIWFHFRVYHMENADKLVHFNFFRARGAKK